MQDVLEPFCDLPNVQDILLEPFRDLPNVQDILKPHLRLARRTLPTWIKGRTCYSPCNMMAHTNTLYFSWVPTPSEALENILKYPEIGQTQSFICKHLHGCMRVMGLNGWESVLMLSLTDFLRFFFFFFGRALYFISATSYYTNWKEKKAYFNEFWMGYDKNSCCEIIL